MAKKQTMCAGKEYIRKTVNRDKHDWIKEVFEKDTIPCRSPATFSVTKKLAKCVSAGSMVEAECTTFFCVDHVAAVVREAVGLIEEIYTMIKIEVMSEEECYASSDDGAV